MALLSLNQASLMPYPAGQVERREGFVGLLAVDTYPYRHMMSRWPAFRRRLTRSTRLLTAADVHCLTPSGRTRPPSAISLTDLDSASLRCRSTWQYSEPWGWYRSESMDDIARTR